MTIQIKQKFLGWWRHRKRRELVHSALDPILADGVQPTRYNKISLHALAASPKPSNDTHQVHFIHILSEASLYNAVLDECSPMTLIRLSQTCVIANRAVNHYIARAFDVNHLLSRYFADTLSFRHLQASTATIIGGSTALQFFARTFWEDTCLDLFVPSVWAGEVGEFLLRSGYSFAPSPLQHPTFDTALFHSEVAEASVTSVPSFKGIVGSFDFTKSTPDCEGVKVRMMVVVRSPVEVILRSHSTCVMNIITFDCAYCLYPRATLEDKISVICTDLSATVMDDAYTKYWNRGWSVVSFDDDILPSTLHSLRVATTTWVGDGFVWSIPCPYQSREDISPITPRSMRLTHDPASIASWTLHRTHKSVGRITFSCFRDPNLFYYYVLANPNVIKLPRVKFLLYAASKVNVHPPHHFRPERHHYVDERFTELCAQYYSITL